MGASSSRPSSRRRTVPRKGWISSPTPSGWHEVIREPRLKAEEWPRHQRQSGWKQGWAAVSEPSRPRVQRRWQRQCSPTEPRRSEGSGTKSGRNVAERVGCIGRIRVSGSSVQAALQEAERAAKERPLAVQVEECQAFITRSQNRLARLEEQRAREQQELDAAMGRMAKFQEEMAKSIPVAPTAQGPTQQVKIPELVSEVERLRSRRCGDGDGTGGGETFQIIVSSFSTSLEGPIWRCKNGELCTAHAGQHRGAIMETLISRGSTLAQSFNRFSPLA